MMASFVLTFCVFKLLLFFLSTHLVLDSFTDCTVEALHVDPVPK